MKLKENTQMNHFNIAVDGPAGAGKAPLQSWWQRNLALYT